MVRREEPFGPGYTAISEEGRLYPEALMDFGILHLNRGEVYETHPDKERALLLMTGDVRFTWADGNQQTAECSRRSILDDEPIALHVSTSLPARVECLGDGAELAIQARTNPVRFPARLWKPGEYRSERFGAGTMQDTSTRTVRTVFDASTAPESVMVLGEVVNDPGKWSSYPPHDHAHPEIYHFRIFPEQGYGHADCETEVYRITNGDTYVIPGGVTHSQCAAPGYALYYIWAIPHLPGNKFGPDSRVFRNEHTWLLDATAPIWPDASLESVIAYQAQRATEDS